MTAARGVARLSQRQEPAQRHEMCREKRPAQSREGGRRAGVSSQCAAEGVRVPNLTVGMPRPVAGARARQQMRGHGDEALDGVLRRAIDASYHDMKGGWDSTAVRWWMRYHLARDENPFAFADPTAPLGDKLHDELRLMRFTVWLVEGKEPGIAVDTAAGYASTVQGFMARHFGVKLGGGLDFERMPRMLKGLHRLKGGKPKRKLRKALTPDKMAKAFLLLDPSNPLHANLRACLATMMQGLMRGCEAVRSAKRSRRQGNAEKDLTRADLVVAEDDSRLTVMMAPAKNEDTLGAKNTPVTIGAGGVLGDAVWEVRNLRAVDPVSEARWGATPAFRDPTTGHAFSVDEVNGWVQRLMYAIGEDGSEYGSHSARIGGATAMFACGSPRPTSE